MCQPCAPAAEDVGRPNHHGIAEPCRRDQRLFDRVHVGGSRGSDPRSLHRLLEGAAVLGGSDGVETGTDQLDSVFLEHTVTSQRHRHVEGGLTAEGREQSIGPLLGDDCGDHFGRYRLQVCGVSECGIGHDRRRVRVDEDDAVPVFPEHLERLGARIVELCGLSDDDRAGADEEDRLDVGPTRHATLQRRSGRRGWRRHSGLAPPPGDTEPRMPTYPGMRALRECRH